MFNRGNFKQLFGGVAVREKHSIVQNLQAAVIKLSLRACVFVPVHPPDTQTKSWNAIQRLSCRSQLSSNGEDFGLKSEPELFGTKQQTEWLSWVFLFFFFLGELHISISFDYSIDQHTCVTFILTGEIGLQQTPSVSKRKKTKRHRTHSHTQTPHFYDELGAWWERDLKTSISYFLLPNQSIYYPKLHFSGSPRTCRSLHNKLR